MPNSNSNIQIAEKWCSDIFDFFQSDLLWCNIFPFIQEMLLAEDFVHLEKKSLNYCSCPLKNILDQIRAFNPIVRRLVSKPIYAGPCDDNTPLEKLYL